MRKEQKLVTSLFFLILLQNIVKVYASDSLENKKDILRQKKHGGGTPIVFSHKKHKKISTRAMIVSPCPEHRGCDENNLQSYAYCSYEHSWFWLFGPQTMCNLNANDEGTILELQPPNSCGCCKDEDIGGLASILPSSIQTFLFAIAPFFFSSPSFNCNDLIDSTSNTSQNNATESDINMTETESNATDPETNTTDPETNTTDPETNTTIEVINIETFIDNTLIPANTTAQGNPIVQDEEGKEYSIQFNATTAASGVISLAQGSDLLFAVNCSYDIVYLNNDTVVNQTDQNTDNSTNFTTTGIVSITLIEGKSFGEDLEALFPLNSILVIDGNKFGSCSLDPPSALVNDFNFTTDGFLEIKNVTVLDDEVNRNETIRLTGISRDFDAIFPTRNIVIELTENEQNMKLVKSAKKKCVTTIPSEFGVSVFDKIKLTLFGKIEKREQCATGTFKRLTDRLDLSGIDYSFQFSYSGSYEFKGAYGVKGEKANDFSTNLGSDENVVWLHNLVQFKIRALEIEDLFGELLPDLKFGIYGFMDVVTDIKVAGSFSIIVTANAHLGENDVTIGVKGDWSESIFPNFYATAEGPDMTYGADFRPDAVEFIGVGAEKTLTVEGFYGFKFGVAIIANSKNERNAAISTQIGQKIEVTYKDPPFNPIQPATSPFEYQSEKCFEEHDIEAKANNAWKPLSGEIKVKINPDWWPWDPIDFNPTLEISPIEKPLLLWCMILDDECDGTLCSNGDCIPSNQECPCDPCTAECCAGGECCDSSSCVKFPSCCPGKIKCGNACINQPENGCCPGFKPCQEGPDACIPEYQCCPEKPYTCPGQLFSCHAFGECCKRCNNGVCQQKAGLPISFLCCPEDGEENCGCCGNCQTEGDICCGNQYYEKPERCACGLGGEYCVSSNQFCCNNNCISKNECCPNPDTGCCKDEQPCGAGKCVPLGTCCPEAPQLCNGKCIPENQCCEACPPPNGNICKKAGECCPSEGGGVESSTCGCFSQDDKVCCSNGNTYPKSTGCPCELLGGKYCPPGKKCCIINGAGSCIFEQDCCESTDGPACNDGSCKNSNSNQGCCPEDSCSNGGNCCPRGKKCCEGSCILENDCCPPSCEKCCNGSCIGTDQCCESTEGSSCEDGSCANDSSNEGCCPESQCSDGSCTPPECCGSDDPCCDENSCACESKAECDDSGGSGDPHMVTFDGLSYDCQGGGDFILSKSLNSSLMVQGRFTKIGSVSVFTGVAASLGSNISTIRLFYGQDDQLQLMVNNTYMDPNTIYRDDEVEFLPTGHKDYRISFHSSGVAIFINSRTFSRVNLFDVRLRLPSSFRKEKIIGLLGSPDDNPRNDWMTSLGEILPVPTSRRNLRGLIANAYCALYWCIRDRNKSLFHYNNSLQFNQINHCDDEPSGSIDVSGISGDLLDICGTDFTCLLDGLVFGIEAAMKTVAAQERLFGKSSRFKFSPNRLIVALTTEVLVTVDFPKEEQINFIDNITAFVLYGVNAETGERDIQPLALLEESKENLNTFSATISLHATLPGHYFGFIATPIINGAMNSNFFIESRTSIRSYLHYGAESDCILTNEEVTIASQQWIQDSSINGSAAEKYGWPIGSWCFNNSIDSFNSIFANENNFDEDLSAWDVSNIKSMDSMFHGASSFEGRGLSNWNVSNVETTRNMFRDSTSFREDLCSWGPQLQGRSVDVRDMFRNTGCPMSSFTPNMNLDVPSPFCSQCISNECKTQLNASPNNKCCFQSKDELQHVVHIFTGYSAGSAAREELEYAYGPIGSWCFSSNITSFDSLFSNKNNFNEDLSAWDVSNIESMRSMFSSANSFDGRGLSKWDVSNVATMRSMFVRSSSFQEDLSEWNVSKVTDFDLMFFSADKFNHSLCSWGPQLQGRSVNVDRMFQHTACSTPWYDPDVNLDVPSPFCSQCISNECKTQLNASPNNKCCFQSKDELQHVVHIFTGYSAGSAAREELEYAYGPIGSWCFSSNITSFDSLFSNKNNFNEDLSAWDVSNIESMRSMFSSANSFDGRGLSKWDVSNVATMRSMFVRSSSFQEDLSEWNVSKVTDFDLMFFSADKFNHSLCSWGPQLQGRSVNVDRMFQHTSCSTSLDPDVNLDVPSPFCVEC